MVMFSNANAQSSNDKESGRVFVQRFYDWYNQLASSFVPVKKNGVRSPDIIALKQHSEYFDASLSKAIIDDYDAQSKVRGDIVGLDFDPFLNAQDTGFEYQTGNVKQTGNRFFVDVHCGAKGKRKETLATKTVVIAEIVKEGTSWKFTNFMYPIDGRQDDLMQMLGTYKKDQAKPKHK